MPSLEPVDGDGNNDLPHDRRPDRRARCWWRRRRPGCMQDHVNQAYPRAGRSLSIRPASAWSPSTASMDPQPEDSSPFYDDSGKAVVRRRGQRRAGCGAAAVHRLPDRSMTRSARWMMRCASCILEANDRMTAGCAARAGPGLPPGDRMYPEEIQHDELEKDLIFAGLIGMIDPARAEVQPGAGESARRRHPHDHDHRRLSQHGPRDCRKHWPCCNPATRC